MCSEEGRLTQVKDFLRSQLTQLYFPIKMCLGKPAHAEALCFYSGGVGGRKQSDEFKILLPFGGGGGGVHL